MAAFSKALELGADGIELDVQLSADGTVVVYHDLRLKPEITRDASGRWLASGGLSISRLTLKDLRSYDVGRLDRGTRYAGRYPDQVPADGERIPTLEEVISLLKREGNAGKLWIELKTNPEQPEISSDPIALAGRVGALLERHQFARRAMLISFDWRGLVHARRIYPQIELGFLSAERSWADNIRRRPSGKSPWTAGLDVTDFGGSTPKMIEAAGGDYWSVYFRDLTPKALAEARALGIGINIWTLRKLSDKAAFVALGPDFITTDRPDWFR